MSAELRQRLEAAVTAERSEAAAREQDKAVGSEVTIPSVRTGIRPDQPGRATGPGRAAPPARTPNAGPVAEDEVTEWLGTASGSPAAAAATKGEPPGAEPRSAEPDVPESASWLGAGIAALIVVPALVIGSLAVVAVRHLTGTRTGSPGSAASARQEAARGEAAAWMARQISPGAVVSCDQAMCAALKARGLPARDLLVLGPLSPDPRNSAVVVETAAVRALFGTSLDQAWAPAVLASFGSGSAGITVRVVASHGVLAYQTALAGDLAAAKAAGAALLSDKQVSVPPLASEQLAAGAVDSRLLDALVFVAGHQPISIVRFGNPGPGAGTGVPLRYVDLAERDPAGHLPSATYVRSVRAYLGTADVRFRPASMETVALADGQAVLQVEVTAPSPLGTFGAPPAP
jgi:hypothetical protein